MASTLKGRTLYVCTTPQPDDLDLAAYKALTYVKVNGVGSVGATGTSDNIVTYDEMDSDVLPKAKGISNAGDPQIEVSRRPSDAGQIAMRAAGVTKLTYAFKILDGDSDVGIDPTTSFLRAVVGGPSKPNGRQESFNLEVYTLGVVQREIVLEPQAQAAPTVVRPVSIASADPVPDVSSAALLYAIPGVYNNEPVTRTYQWARDTAGNGTFVSIAGATGASYDAVAADLNNCLRVTETATNPTGNVSSISMTTKPTIA